jgi:hypothetical protein
MSPFRLGCVLAHYAGPHPPSWAPRRTVEVLYAARMPSRLSDAFSEPSLESREIRVRHREAPSIDFPSVYRAGLDDPDVDIARLPKLLWRVQPKPRSMAEGDVCTALFPSDTAPGDDDGRVAVGLRNWPGQLAKLALAFKSEGVGPVDPIPLEKTVVRHLRLGARLWSRELLLLEARKPGRPWLRRLRQLLEAQKLGRRGLRRPRLPLVVLDRPPPQPSVVAFRLIPRIKRRFPIQ